MKDIALQSSGFASKANKKLRVICFRQFSTLVLLLDLISQIYFIGKIQCDSQAFVQLTQLPSVSFYNNSIL